MKNLIFTINDSKKIITIRAVSKDQSHHFRTIIDRCEMHFDNIHALKSLKFYQSKILNVSINKMS